MDVTSSAYPGGICAVAALENIYDKLGYHTLNRTLRLIIGTWKGANLSFSANMMKGVSRLIVAYGDKLKDDLFKERLSKVSVKEISRTAKDRKAGALGYAEALLLIYNRKVHNPLPIERLYTHKNHNSPVSSESDIPNEFPAEDTPQQYELFGAADEYSSHT